jgi:hypothetical protein
MREVRGSSKGLDLKLNLLKAVASLSFLFVLIYCIYYLGFSTFHFLFNMKSNF